MLYSPRFDNATGRSASAMPDPYRPRTAPKKHIMSGTTPTILALSSTVAAGHVGLSAIVPTLHLIGRTAIALPTITLSNHPGFGHVSGIQTPPETLLTMIDALEQNGWLANIDTILTGYLPSAAHVNVASTAINRVRALNPDARYICDPVLGDDPKGLYIDATAANAIRDDLIPLADIALPNRFELSWLTGTPVASPHDAITAARKLPQTRQCPRIIAKSIPSGTDQICNIDITRNTATSITIQTLEGVPNGTGDMLSGLIAAGWSLPRATAALTSVINASLGENHLAIVPAADQWRNATALPAQPL
ncbi:MAG: pyridoxine kinase [Hyphomicrobiaceae bacterium]|jgi:pyridoxine kinase